MKKRNKEIVNCKREYDIYECSYKCGYSPKELCQTVTEHVEVFLCFLSLMLDCGIFQINEIKRHLLV